MSDFLRVLARDEHEASLRAVFVDQNCVYLGSALIAEGEAEVCQYDPRAVLDAAFVAGAVGLVLGRRLGKYRRHLSNEEIAKARWLHGEGERNKLFLLDYVVVRDMDGPTQSCILQEHHANGE